MPALLPPKRLLQGAVLLALLLALLLVTRQLQFVQRSWYQAIEWWNVSEWRDRSIWLPDYVASQQAMPIAGIDNNLSGLAYDPSRNSLFAITNKSPHVIELTLDGRVLRQIPLIGFRDPEAIVYISPGKFLIADEREHRLLEVRLTDDTPRIDAADAKQLSIGIGLNGNKGFEGLAYDPGNNRVFVAKERDPVRILEVRGFPQSDPSQPLAVHVDGNPQHNALLFVRDLSSLHYDESHGHLLAVSDESRVLLELGVDGKPISHLSLRGGQHGLKDDVPQAEGMTMDTAGNLYIVSEPNLFYVFKKNPRK